MSGSVDLCPPQPLLAVGGIPWRTLTDERPGVEGGDGEREKGREGRGEGEKGGGGESKT